MCANQLNIRHTMTITTTIAMGTTNNCIRNPAEGGCTGGRLFSGSDICEFTKGSYYMAGY